MARGSWLYDMGDSVVLLGSVGTGGGESDLDKLRGFLRSSATDALWRSFLGEPEALADSIRDELGLQGASSLVALAVVGATMLRRDVAFGVSPDASFCSCALCCCLRSALDTRFLGLALGVVDSAGPWAASCELVVDRLTPCKLDLLDTASPCCSNCDQKYRNSKQSISVCFNAVIWLDLATACAKLGLEAATGVLAGVVTASAHL